MRQHKNLHSTGSGLGNGGECKCELCNIIVPHEKGMPCTNMVCPNCGRPLSRGEASANLKNENNISNKRVAIIVEEECNGCTLCISSCPFDAISMENSKAIIEFDKCRGCMKCVPACPVGAIKRG